jgi:hypothetical protein
LSAHQNIGAVADIDADLMSGVIVIVAYRPKPGKETELLELVRSRVPTLRKENLVTGREPTIMRARSVQNTRGSGRNVSELRATLIARCMLNGRGTFSPAGRTK